MKTLKLAALTFIISFCFSNALLFAQSPVPVTTIGGNWLGVLPVNGDIRLRLLLKVSAAADGSLSAVMDSLDQANANNLKVDSITFQNGVLHFEMKALQIAYQGSLVRAGEIVGTFTQGGGQLRLIFRKEGAASSNAVVKRGRVELKPCNDPVLTSEILCAKYEVFEDRAAHSGRKISLNIVLLPALNSKPP